MDKNLHGGGNMKSTCFAAVAALCLLTGVHGALAQQQQPPQQGQMQPRTQQQQQQNQARINALRQRAAQQQRNIANRAKRPPVVQKNIGKPQQRPGTVSQRPVNPQRRYAPNAYVKQAAQGQKNAHTAIAQMYENGHNGMPRDLVQALKWYLRAAAMGNPRAVEKARELQAQMSPRQIAQARMLASSGSVPVQSAAIVEVISEQPQQPAQIINNNETVIINETANQPAAAQAASQQTEPADIAESSENKATSYVVIGTMTDSGAVSAAVAAAPAAPAVPDWEYQIPSGEPNKDAIGVIIAPSVYANKDIPPVKYALNDAKLMKEYFIKVFGIPEGNIIYAENPTLAQFNRIFGTSENPNGELANYTKPGKSDVYIYYVGHGAPDMVSHKAYFIPVDGSADYVRTDAYPLDLFYANLAKLPAKSVNVFLDACFSGGSPSGNLVKSASPLALQVATGVLPKNINVLASSSESQISSWYDEKGHSLFTYYMLGMISSRAENGGKLNFGNLYQLVSEDVTYSARRLFGRDQVPQFHGNADAVLLRYK